MHVSPADSGSVSKQNLRRTVGVLGGMGPAATVDFLQRLVEATFATSDQDHIRVLVDSDPSVPDRTAHLLGDGEDPRPALRRMARGLARAGADLLVMPCNTAHAYAAEIERAVSIPLVDWPGVVADGVQAADRACVGILATRGTVVAGIYQRAFGLRGVDVVVPAEPTQDGLMEAIYGADGIKSVGRAGATSRRLLLDAAQQLVSMGADGLVLACTELSVVHGLDPVEAAVPVFDAADIVARHVVELAGARLSAG